MTKRLLKFRSSRQRRGFTLVELLAVVAMIGILSAIALVGYRKYINSAKTAEAKQIVHAIRISEEAYRSETMSYLSCSGNLTDYYPHGSDFSKPYHWIQGTHADASCWRQLNVPTDKPTLFRFAVVAGAPGGTPPTPSSSRTFTWPNPTTEPWYVIQGAGDTDQDANYVFLVGSSFTGAVYIENEGE